MRRFYERRGMIIGKWLSKTGLAPNHITILSLGPAVIGFMFIVNRYLLVGTSFFVLSFLFDIADGCVARYSGKATVKGRVLDHAVDRSVEFLLLLSLSMSYINPIIGMVSYFSMILPSYIRECSQTESVGIGRKEKLVIILLGIIVYKIEISLILVSLASLFTAVRRLSA